MIDPNNHSFLLDYLRAVREAHRTIDFIDTGIATRESAASAHYSDRLYVVPDFSETYIDPQALEDQWPEVLGLNDLTKGYKRLFLLGDPGMGKTTLVRRLATLMSNASNKAFSPDGTPMVPFPLTLREINFAGVDSWEKLLAAYFTLPPYQKLTYDPELILKVFESGQAFVLLDGLDEVNAPALRKLLSDLALEGMERFPDCTWWFTSRIVGFNQAVFLREVEYGEWEKNYKIVVVDNDGTKLKMIRDQYEDSLVNQTYPQLYLAPFSNAHIRRFMSLWFDVQEPNEMMRQQGLEKFMESLADHERIQHLARTPNLLTMMAIFFRMNQRFPDGRIELFKTIAKAYLDGINRKRNIKAQHRLSYAIQFQCMAALALEMQAMRAASDEKEHVQLTIVEDRAVEIFCQTFQATSRNHTEAEIAEQVAQYFRSLHYRSEILIPKTSDSYGFFHLSYQEYFAAEALQDKFREVTSRWAEDGAEDAFWERMQGYAETDSWHETIVLFFEGFHPDLGGSAKECVYAFEKIFEWEKETGAVRWRRGMAAAKVLTDAYISDSFSSAERFGVLDWLFIYNLNNARSYLTTWGGKNGYYTELTPKHLFPSAPETLRWVKSSGEVPHLNGLKEALNCVYLDLRKTQVSDLKPLAAMTRLRRLSLNETQVSDLKPLAAMTRLRRLSLNETQVSDAEVAQLKAALPRLTIFRDKE